MENAFLPSSPASAGPPTSDDQGGGGGECFPPPPTFVNVPGALAAWKGEGGYIT